MGDEFWQELSLVVLGVGDFVGGAVGEGVLLAGVAVEIQVEVDRLDHAESLD